MFHVLSFKKKGFTPLNLAKREFRRGRNYLTGFTLIEILIVISVIVILVGISVPVFRRFQPGLQLSGAVRNLVTDIRYTQQLTVTEQVEYCLRFFPLEKKYQIIQCDQSQPLLEKFLPDKIKTLTLTGFTNDEVRFNPYGAVKKSGTITLENIQNETKNIEVRPSGFVRITD